MLLVDSRDRGYGLSLVNKDIIANVFALSDVFGRLPFLGISNLLAYFFAFSCRVSISSLNGLLGDCVERQWYILLRKAYLSYQQENSQISLAFNNDELANVFSADQVCLRYRNFYSHYLCSHFTTQSSQCDDHDDDDDGHEARFTVQWSRYDAQNAMMSTTWCPRCDGHDATTWCPRCDGHNATMRRSQCKGNNATVTMRRLRCNGHDAMVTMRWSRCNSHEPMVTMQ